MMNPTTFRSFVLVSLFVLTANLAFGQLEKTIHQTFEVDDFKTVSLDLKGEYEVEAWAGNTVMTETKIKLFNGTPYILDHFVEKQKRYFIEADTANAGILTLVSHDKKRDTIKAKSGECTEVVLVRVFMPDNFKAVDAKTYRAEPK